MDKYAGITAVMAIDKENKIINLTIDQPPTISDPETGESKELTHIKSIEQLESLLPVKATFIRLNEADVQMETGIFDFDQENYKLLIAGNSTQINKV